jgi:GNAT superfamily N-acetyltransferase
MAFEFKEVGDQRDLQELRVFVHAHELWYPQYHDWVDEVCIPEIDMGYKTGVLGWKDGEVVGNIIFQPHKQLTDILELKNIRISPNARKRGIGYFLMRQMECAARDSGFSECIGDTDKRSKDMLGLAQYMGYSLMHSRSIYDPNNEDVVFLKKVA